MVGVCVRKTRAKVRLIKRTLILFSGNTDITWTEIIENFVKVQEEIRVKLEHLEMKLDRILNKLFPDEIKLNRPHGIPAFPLRTQEEWDKMETILADDDAFTYVVLMLSVYFIFYCMFFRLRPVTALLK